MDYELIEKENMYFIGFSYRGTIKENLDQFQNQVDDCWNTLADFCVNRWAHIEDEIIDPKLSYEIQLWNKEELEQNGLLNIFVGLEVKDLETIPIEMTGKLLPKGKYILFNLKGEEIHGWEDFILQEWLPESNYWLRMFNEHLFHVQRFHEDRFKGVENIEESELDILVPVEKVD